MLIQLFNSMVQKASDLITFTLEKVQNFFISNFIQNFEMLNNSLKNILDCTDFI